MRIMSRMLNHIPRRRKALHIQAYRAYYSLHVIANGDASLPLHLRAGRGEGIRCEILVGKFNSFIGFKWSITL